MMHDMMSGPMGWMIEGMGLVGLLLGVALVLAIIALVKVIVGSGR